MSTTTQQQGGSGPPPKPWERADSSSGPTPFRPSSGGATSDVVESSGTAKPGEIVSTSNQNNSAVNTNIAGRPLPSRPWESSYGNTSYGGYGSGLTSGVTGYGTGYGSGSGMYNSYGGGYGGVGGGIGGVGGMYGSSMYRGAYGGGGGLYGSSGMYGGLGGGGMYNSGMGGPMGGYGMGGGPYGPPDPNNPPASPPGFWISFLRVMEGVVNFFGRISVLVDQNTQAVHLFMSALLQLCNQGGMLYGELALFVLKILGRRRSKKLHPTGPDGLPLPGPDGQMDQRFIEGPKGPPAGPWDNVWGNGPNR